MIRFITRKILSHYMPLKTTLREDEYERVKAELDQELVRLDESEFKKVKLKDDEVLKTYLNPKDIMRVSLEE